MVFTGEEEVRSMTGLSIDGITTGVDVRVRARPELVGVEKSSECNRLFREGGVF